MRTHIWKQNWPRQPRFFTEAIYRNLQRPYGTFRDGNKTGQNNENSEMKQNSSSIFTSVFSVSL